jgi:hypothetical protein
VNLTIKLNGRIETVDEAQLLDNEIINELNHWKFDYIRVNNREIDEQLIKKIINEGICENDK